MSFRDTSKHWINALFGLFGLIVVNAAAADDATPAFIGAKQTIAGANAAGLSLEDFIDGNSAAPGATGQTVDAMFQLIDSDQPVRRVLEIGPGSGRYTGLVQQRYVPERYEVYESARDWLPYLRQTYGVQIQPCDGRSLSSTRDSTIDLAHSHKTLCYIPFVTTVGYLDEMVRVVRPGGYMAFDVVTERCLDRANVENWVRQDLTIYNLTPRDWLIGYLDERGAHYVGGCLVPMSRGLTEFMTFRRSIDV